MAFKKILFASLLLSLLGLTACGTAASPTSVPATSAPSAAPATQAATVAPTTAPAQAATVAATQAAAANAGVAPTAAPTAAGPTPTDVPPTGVSVTWGFIPSQQSQKVLDSAQSLANLLSARTGIKFNIVVASDYSGLIESMCSGQSQMGSLATFAYIVASARKCADVGLVVVRNKLTTYRSQFITKADSGLKTIADLKGKTFCRPDALSTSGWIIPSITMKANGVDPTKDLKQILDVGGHDAVVKNVYQGNCDAGATFDDARTLVAKALPDVNDKVVIMQYSSNIPNDTISFAKSFDATNRATIVKALLDISADPANATLLNNVYQWTALQEAKDAFYDDFRQQLQAAGVDPESFIAKAPAAAATSAAAPATSAAPAATVAATAS
ncbi:MAG TPA: phosphate/phosphite/phosphonate ABC transporter substrate-binding protein [Aggregatilineales bacterium]|nr:phosphate/phosphite/phosphonate ABC transporter substrate-binding protein [Aggregatilineales bacterium]